jgi:hypothetical protein
LKKSDKTRPVEGAAKTGQVGPGHAESSQAGSPPARAVKPLAGAVLHDDRGNAVWHWTSETARNAVASTSALLKRLNVANLSLEESLEKTRVEESRQAAWVAYSAAAAAARAAAPRKAAAGARLATPGNAGAPGKAVAPGKGTPAAKPIAPGKGVVAAKSRARVSLWRQLFQRR